MMTRSTPRSKACAGSTTTRLRLIEARIRRQDRQAPARRRSAAGRDEGRQGVRRGEAQAAAGRQDGRPSRQQGRHLQDQPARRHAVPGRRHAGRHRSEPAGRAFAHERRSDPRNPHGLGLRRHRQDDRRGARRSIVTRRTASRSSKPCAMRMARKRNCRRR
jgi:hypothetical protein